MPPKLKFAIGYQLPERRCISDIVAEFAADIEEVCFPWMGVVNGRRISIAGAEEQQLMEKELAAIHALFIASCVKRTFPQIEVRASVNMGIGSVTAMKCVQASFDSFYVRRELNRFPAQIKVLRDWCAANGKRLYLLANSGCLKDCPAHTFHDNLVSHEGEIAREQSPWCGFRGVCWDCYADPSNHASFLLDSTWIRPEEIDAYCGLVDGVKLATRMHRDPERVITSYVHWLERFGALSGSERENLCKEELEHVRR